MAVQMTVLASGSGGNATVISSASTSILVDAGLSCKETLKRMALAGEDPGRLSAILITHEHSDHVAGLRVLARKLEIPVYISGLTYAAYRRWARDPNGERVNIERVEHFEPGRTFHVGDIAVTPFTIPHDAADPCGFKFKIDGVKVAIATDLGCMTANVREQLKGCDGMMIESNHDLEMLRTGPYPWSVKQRVMSRVGHLSNDALADFFSSNYDGAAAFLILAHLSAENNHPELARTCAEKALGGRRSLFQNSRLMLASQDAPLDPVRL